MKKIERKLILRPEDIPCARHKSFNDECVACGKLKKARKAAYMDKVNALAYGVVYKYWKQYLAETPELVDKKLSAREIKAKRVLIAKRRITTDCFPFKSSARREQVKAWESALDELSLKLEDSHIPVGVFVDKETGKKIKEPLWF